MGPAPRRWPSKLLTRDRPINCLHDLRPHTGLAIPGKHPNSRSKDLPTPYTDPSRYNTGLARNAAGPIPRAIGSNDREPDASPSRSLPILGRSQDLSYVRLRPG